MELEIATPRVFLPLLAPSRYKGAWGGRGSGKSHFFAESVIEQCIVTPGTRAVCVREVQKTLKESSKRLIEDKLQSLGLGQAQGFRVFQEVIQTPGDGVIMFQGMADHNAESIKSLEGCRIAWVEEAQSLSARSLSLLRPTIREADSEIWFSWNPRRKTDAVDELLRGANLPTGAVVVRANWSDNPFFPSVLEQERQDCLRLNPEQYDHIWEGGYATITEGAYYSQAIAQARLERRIGRVAADPLMTVRLFIDIGGTGAKADSFSMWAAQFIGKEIRVLAYYEAQGQPLATHLAWMRSQGYQPNRAQVWLPHDGGTHDRVYDVSYESALKDAGYEVTIIPNQGKGASMARVESVRRMFPAIWVNEQSCAAGIDALGWYHERKDEVRNVGLGPEHDWACLPAGTKINTPSGSKSVEDFAPGDRVSICGKEPLVKVARKVGKKEIVLINLPNRVNVRCSVNHKIFTKSGLVEARDIKPGMVLLTENEVYEWSESKKGILGAFSESFKKSSIGSGEKGGCTPARSGGSKHSSIDPYGLLKTGRSKRPTLLSLLMGIGKTLLQKIGFAGHMLTTAGISKQYTMDKSSTALPSEEYRKQDITGQRQPGPRFTCIDMFGSSTMARLTTGWLSTISTITKQTTLSKTSNCSRRLPTRSIMEKLVLSVEVQAQEDVFDIEVEHHHAYVLSESSVVTSNSHGADAFGLMCIAYEEPQIEQRNRPSRPLNWMG